MVPGSNLGPETIKHVCIMKGPGSNLGQETFKHVYIMKVPGSNLGQETFKHECVSYWFLNLFNNAFSNAYVLFIYVCIMKVPGSNLGQETICSVWQCYVCVKFEQVLGLCLSIGYI
jgi:hypothetical protein